MFEFDDFRPIGDSDMRVLQREDFTLCVNTRYAEVWASHSVNGLGGEVLASDRLEHGVRLPGSPRGAFDCMETYHGMVTRVDQDARRELDERAYWAARDTATVA